jgi:pyruvate,orthophosphate dikinase
MSTTQHNEPVELEDLVYAFDSPPPVDQARWPSVLGGKGAGLARMRALGLPVPPGFTIPAHVCNRVLADGWFDDLDVALSTALDELESTMGRRLGATDEPLLVSVRSGAMVSMPGMMDTVLNVGMTEDVARALGRWGADEHFGWDTYRRFVEGYATIVSGASTELISELVRVQGGGHARAQLAAADYGRLAVALREGLAEAGHPIPDDPRQQVTEAVKAVFASWSSPRAVTYRQREGVDGHLGTAANVQAMVFGNLGDRSGTGVVFSRDPSTGANGLLGDFLIRGQGEDVVAGTHLTQSIDDMESVWPDLAGELATVAMTLEQELRDLVDIEFTVENGKLWLLQSRVGKRSPQAALRLAVAMADDDSFPLERSEAVERVAELLDNPPSVSDGEEEGETMALATGLAASPGRAVGTVCLDPDEAMRRGSDGEAVILVRPETSPADVHGMVEATGLVTTLGGLVSHAAVVARSWGLPAVVGVSDLTIEADGIIAGGQRVAVGETITVDGDQGRILIGSHPGAGTEMPEVAVLRAWRDGTHAGHGLHGDHMAVDEPVPADVVVAAEVTPVECRRVLVLKGMATASAVAEVLRTEEEAVATAFEQLMAEGHVQAGPGDRFMMTPDGTAAAEADYVAEAEVAGPAIEPHFDRFNAINLRFKEVVTSWQMRDLDGEMVMNDHEDADYDASVLAALADEIHASIVEIVNDVSRTVGRLGPYVERLQEAIDAVAAGDLEMMAHPLRESYHTVWFELHEEIIRLSGRNRADEAAAGRA